MQKKSTLYLSPTFASLEEAQKALSHDAFFLFDIHQVLFHCQGLAPFIRAFFKIKKKPLTIFQGMKALLLTRTWKALHARYAQGNRVTEVYLDAAHPLQPLHSQLIDFSNNIYAPDTAVYALLKDLRKDHKLFILSNIGRTTFLRLKQQYPDYFALMSYPENTINQHDTLHAVWKPQLTAYQIALRTLQRTHVPHLAIFVDDKDTNCKAAQATGMNAIRFTCIHQFKNDLSLLLGRTIPFPVSIS